ncbi:hypothetical protein Desti_3659 [Desulfomonile tiedjei DSM 6799]|uniref:Uncharacterized protein n=1 Tax=Desulfomonile tiedjei (strain ATCC 49306 / DSM 6799 / DCB-1) TaxID=706587 RepID=I4C9R4_DESTA|nr:hypothetical protein Desti_3659 [Desulfomonile tiedjei DSM 6799]
MIFTSGIQIVNVEINKIYCNSLMFVGIKSVTALSCRTIFGLTAGATSTTYFCESECILIKFIYSDVIRSHSLLILSFSAINL